MAQTLHQLRAIVTSKITGFARGMHQAAQATQQLRMAWGTAARDISSAATRITGAVAAMGAGIGRTFGQFELTMAKVGAVTRTLGTRDFKQLEDFAREMGRTTIFSASEAAEAMEKMGLAGLRTREIIEALPGTLDLAAAAQVSIAQAAEISAKTMRAFGLEAAELERIGDTLVATANSVNTDLVELFEALKPVGPVAKSINVSLEETVAILGKMADAGFGGSLGGTALRNAMLRLAKPAAEANRYLREFNVLLSDTFAVKLEKIQAGLRGVEDPMQRLAVVSAIFGVRGGPQMLEIFDKGIDGVAEFAKELEAARGTMARVSEAMQNTLWGAFKLIASQIEDLVLSAGKELRPVFDSLGKSVSEFIEANKPAIVRTMVAAVTALSTAATSLFEWLGENSDQLSVMAGSIATVVTRIGEWLTEHPKLMGALLALKVAGLLGVTQALGSLGMALSVTITTLTGPFLAALGTVETALIGFGFSAQAAWNMAFLGIPLLITALIGLAAVFVAKKDEILEAIRPIAEPFERLAEHIQNRLQPKLEELWQTFSARIEPAIDRITKAVDNLIPTLEEMVDALQPLIDLQLDQLETELVVLTEALGLFADVVNDDVQKAMIVWDHSIGPVLEQLDAIAERVATIIGSKEDLADFVEEAFAAQQGIRKWQKVRARNQKEREQRLQRQAAEAAAAASVPPDDLPPGLEAGAGPPPAPMPADQPPVPGPVAGQPPGQPPGPAAGPEARAEEAAAEAAREIADAIRQADLEAIEKTTPGFGEFRDFAGMEGVTGQQLAQFAGAKGMSADDARAMGQSFDGLQQEFGGQVPEYLVDILVQQFVDRLNAASEMAERGQQAAEQLRPFADRLRELAQQGTIGEQWAQQRIDEALRLSQQYRDGTVSADQYRAGMERLREATDSATAAAQRKAEQERQEAQRDALIKGDFAGAGLNFQDAVKDQIAQMQRQRFDMFVSQAANRFAQMNGILPRVNQGFQQVNHGMQQFGQHLQQFPGMMMGGGGGSLPGPQQAFQQITSFLGTQAGQVAALRNQIALQQQKVNLFNTNKSPDSFFSFGFGSRGYRDFRKAEIELKKLYRDLNRILYEPPPQFTDLLGSGKEFFKDPGLQTPQNVEIKVELPNMTRISSTEASTLARVVGDEFKRQGRAL